MMSGEFNARKLLYLNRKNTVPRYGSSRDMPLRIATQPFRNVYKHYIQEKHNPCVISGFRREVDKNCALPGYYAASSGNFLPTYELIYQLDAIEYLFVYFQLDMFRAYTPIFRSNGCYNFFTYAAYGVLGVVRCRS